jgi:hypothetical protein
MLIADQAATLSAHQFLPINELFTPAAQPMGIVSPDAKVTQALDSGH